MSATTQAQQAERFRALHTGPGLLVLPNGDVIVAEPVPLPEQLPADVIATGSCELAVAATLKLAP